MNIPIQKIVYGPVTHRKMLLRPHMILLDGDPQDVTYWINHGEARKATSDDRIRIQGYNGQTQ